MQRVITCQSRQQVVAITAAEIIVAGGAIDRVRSGSPAERSQEQHIHGSAIQPRRTIENGSNGEFVDTVAVQVAQRRDGSTEKVPGGERGAAVGIAGNFQVALHRAVGIQQQHMQRAVTVAFRAILIGPDGQISHTVAIQVTQRRDGNAEVVFVLQRRSAVRVVGNLHAALHRTVRVQQQNMHGPASRASRVIAIGTDRQIGHTVAVQVPQRRHGKAESVIVRERGSTVRSTGNLQGALHGPICVQQQHIHGSSICSAVAIAVSSDGQINHAVAIQVADRCHLIAEGGGVGERRATVRAAGDLHAAFHGAVRVQQQHIHPATTTAAGVIAFGCDGQIVHAVAIQVTQCRHRTAEEVEVRQHRPTINAAGNLHAALDGAVGVHEQHIDCPTSRVVRSPVGIVATGPNH